jgi:hypothetical protein
MRVKAAIAIRSGDLERRGGQRSGLRAVSGNPSTTMNAKSSVVAHILGWSASTAARTAKRYGHIRPEVQRQALDAVATAEVQAAVNQTVHQVENTVESRLPN